MNLIQRWTCLSFLALGLLFGRTASASLVEALDLDALVTEADQVVLARVIAQESHYDQRGRIVTDVALQVEESIKGGLAPGASVTVRRLGGEVGDMGMRVAGEPSFVVGETVVLFGARSKGGVLRPVGMSQGALRVFEKDGVRWARSANNGVATVKRGAKGRLENAVPAVPEPRKLDELMNELRSIAKSKERR